MLICPDPPIVVSTVPLPETATVSIPLETTAPDSFWPANVVTANRSVPIAAETPFITTLQPVPVAAQLAGTFTFELDGGSASDTPLTASRRIAIDPVFGER
jgi:hypothetical protein